MAPGLQLNIEDLAQALFLVLGLDEVRNEGKSEVSTEKVADLSKQLWLALARTRTINNSSASVNRLPPEILAHIFSLLQSPIPKSSFPLPKAFNSWFAILEVCRYWRITALAFPRLWYYVYVRGRFDDPATMSIRHSGSIPLKVFYDLNSDRTFENRGIEVDDPLSLLSKEVDRVQELHLSSEAWDTQFLMEILTSPAPTLEILTLLGSWRHSDSDRILPRLFSNCTPRLKAVVLSYISCDPLENFRNLTYLSLYNQMAPGRRPSSEKFLQILRYSPELQELVLVRAGPDEGHPTLPPEMVLKPVVLPRLQILEIGYYPTPNIHFFLSHLVIPKQVTRRIFDHQLDELAAFLNQSPTKNTRINKCLEGHPTLPPEMVLKPVVLPRLQILEIGYYPTPNIHFFLSHLVIPKQVTRRIFDHQLDELAAFLNVAAHGPYTQIRRIAITDEEHPYKQMFGIKGTMLYVHGHFDFSQIRSLFSEAILPNVQELILGPLPEYMPSSPQLHHMLRSLPLLTTLTLAGGPRVHLHHLISCLGIFYDAQPNTDATNVMNPHLCVIKVFKYVQSRANDEQHSDILPLVLLSQARADVGHPIEKLEVEGCQPDQLEELQGHLGATKLVSHEQSYGEHVIGKVLDEMWNHIRDSAPVLQTN